MEQKAAVKIAVNLEDPCLDRLVKEGLLPYFTVVNLTAEAEFIVTDKKPSQKNMKSVIFISYEKDPALIAGVDLIVPFRMGKLIALIEQKIKSLTVNDFNETSITIGSYIIEVQTGDMVSKSGLISKRLTEKERDILCSLYNRKGERVHRQTLLDEVWGYVEGIETHTLETHIYRLRQKIEEDPSCPQFLVTDDTGYKLDL